MEAPSDYFLKARFSAQTDPVTVGPSRLWKLNRSKFASFRHNDNDQKIHRESSLWELAETI